MLSYLLAKHACLHACLHTCLHTYMHTWLHVCVLGYVHADARMAQMDDPLMGPYYKIGPGGEGTVRLYFLKGAIPL